MDDLTYATREQLQIINDLGGSRNAQRILYRMEQDRIVSAVRYEKKVYFLSIRGKQQIGSDQGELKKSHITHILMRNDLYISLGMPGDWRKEKPVMVNGNPFVIPDATYTHKGEYHFVEIDNQQAMRTNFDKIDKYKELSRAIFAQLSHTPTLVWYTLSDVRRQKLTEACKKAGVKYVMH